MVNDQVPQYDFFITHSGTQVGYLLDRETYDDPQVPPPWVEGLVPSLAPSTRTDDFGYGHLPPEVSVVVPTDSWRGGAGIERADHLDTYFEADGVDASWGHPILAARQDVVGGWASAEAAPTKFVSTADGTLWALATRYLYRFDFTDDPPVTAAFNAGASGVLTDMVEHNGVLYLARGDDTAYLYSEDDGTNWVESTRGINFTRFAVRDSILWGATSTGGLRNTLDGLNGGVLWSAEVQVGSTSETLETLLVSDGDLFVCTSEAVHRYSGLAQTTIFKSQFPGYSGNGRALASIDGSIYAAYGGVLMRLTNEAAAPDWPAPEMTGNASAMGSVRAIGESRDSLFIVTDSATGQHFLWRKPGGGRWHIVAHLSEDCDAMTWTFSGDNPRVVVGRAQGAATMTYPRPGLTPDTDDNCRFVTSGSITGTYRAVASQLFNKRMRAVAALADRVTEDRYVRVFAETDTVARRLMLAATETGATRRELGTQGVTFRDIRWHATLATDDDSATPRLRALTWEVAPEPPRYRQWTLRARCNGASRGGGQGVYTPAMQVSHLFAGRGTSVVLLDTSTGERVAVLVFTAQRIRDLDNGDSTVSTTLIEAGGAVDSVGVLKYNSGIRYNTGFVYP